MRKGISAVHFISCSRWCIRGRQLGSPSLEFGLCPGKKKLSAVQLSPLEYCKIWFTITDLCPGLAKRFCPITVNVSVKFRRNGNCVYARCWRKIRCWITMLFCFVFRCLQRLPMAGAVFLKWFYYILPQYVVVKKKKRNVGVQNGSVKLLVRKSRNEERSPDYSDASQKRESNSCSAAANNCHLCTPIHIPLNVCVSSWRRVNPCTSEILELIYIIYFIFDLLIDMHC